ncbi:hypothetical protein HY622_04150 [Candidatus Uhrbacteria bacterium]|nr:hypothetical protein [Candidatus Uhrbacteria bacterium]
MTNTSILSFLSSNNELYFQQIQWFGECKPCDGCVREHCRKLFPIVSRAEDFNGLTEKRDFEEYSPIPDLDLRSAAVEKLNKCGGENKVSAVFDDEDPVNLAVLPHDPAEAVLCCAHWVT